MMCSSPTTTLLVSNLPTLLFSQPQDLHPLFFPFGHIDSLEVAHISRLGCMSVILQYSSIASAQEAKDSLNGQLYGSFRIETRYVRLSSLVSSNTSRTPGTSGLLLERRMTDPLPRSSVDLQDYLNDGQITPPVSRGRLFLGDSAAISSSLGTLPHYDLFADHKSKPVGPAATYLTNPYGIHDFSDLNSIINYGLVISLTYKYYWPSWYSVGVLSKPAINELAPLEYDTPLDQSPACLMWPRCDGCFRVLVLPLSSWFFSVISVCFFNAGILLFRLGQNTYMPHEKGQA